MAKKKRTKYIDNFPLLDSDTIKLVRDNGTQPFMVVHTLVGTPNGQAYMGPMKVWQDEDNPRNFTLSINTLSTNSSLYRRIKNDLSVYSESVPPVEQTIIRSVLKKQATWDSLVNSAAGSSIVNGVLTASFMEIINNLSAIYYYFPDDENVDQDMVELTKKIDKSEDAKLMFLSEDLERLFHKFFSEVMSDDGSVQFTDDFRDDYMEMVNKLS